MLTRCSLTCFAGCFSGCSACLPASERARAFILVSVVFLATKRQHSVIFLVSGTHAPCISVQFERTWFMRGGARGSVGRFGRFTVESGKHHNYFGKPVLVGIYEAYCLLYIFLFWGEVAFASPMPCLGFI